LGLALLTIAERSADECQRQICVNPRNLSITLSSRLAGGGYTRLFDALKQSVRTTDADGGSP
jgi:hypothetical protein